MFGKLKKILAKRELDEDKRDVELEKNDFLAIAIALGSIMFPVLIAAFAIIGLFVWIIF